MAESENRFRELFYKREVRPSESIIESTGAGASPRRSSRVRARLSPLVESFRIAIGSLRANKLRTALTLVGIVVGVAAVIAVVTIIKGLDYTVASTFSSQGSTVFTVRKNPRIVLSREDAIRFNRRRDVTETDAAAVARLCTACWRTGLEDDSFATVKHDERESEGVEINGITLPIFDIEDINVEWGRVWSESEAEAGRDVAIIGASVLDNIFPETQMPERAIGQEVRIGGHPFRIVGVSERLGNIFGFPRDNFVYMPYATYRRIFGTRDSLIIHVQVEDVARLEEAQDQVRAAMRNRRGKNSSDPDDGFALETEDVFLDLYRRATANIYLVTIGVAAISLVVGGIVVMNIMLVSVTERTKEIGIRKAIGASRRDVLTQFLVEAVVLTAIGGAIGVAFGFVLAYTLSALVGFPLFFSLWSAVLGVAVSSSVGIISGLWPAWKAARLDPIEALRAE